MAQGSEAFFKPPRQTTDSAKREAFTQLGEEKTMRAMEAIRDIASLADPQHYDYAERDVLKIAWALKREVEMLKQAMLEARKKAKLEFKL